VTGQVRLISMLAGVPLADLAARLPDARAHIRILPNLAARIGAGVTAVATLGDADDQAMTTLLTPLGQVLPMADDSAMDLITAFTGSGPAFVFSLVESYAAAGERLGLSNEDALALALATFGGAIALLDDSGEKPGVLITQVASKGGTTQAGLDVLDGDGQLAALMTNVLRAARDRGRELADLARGDD
jgi:pyrroline-5-carboxylate reductase